MRKILGILAGAVIAMLMVAIVEMIGHRLYPPPAGLDMSRPNDVARYVSAAPAGALVAVVLGWFLGTAAGGWSAVAIGRWPAAAWIIAALIALAGIWNATQIPAPLWMQLATVVAPALGGLVAHSLAGKRV